MKLRYKNEEHVFDECEKNGVPFLKYPLFEETGLVNHGFSTRLGGVSKGGCSTMNISIHRGDDPEAVEENKRRIASAIGVEPESMVYTQQTHTTNVKRVGKKDCGTSLPETDGIITNEPEVCLVTFYADCVPLYFVDPVKKAIGLSHSGWRGTVNNMAQATVDAMVREFGSEPKDILAAVGPSICQECYEVSEDVILEFKEKFKEEHYEKLFYQKQNGKYQLNLWKANEIRFLEAGILSEHMAISNLCTCCNPDVLFSHRVTGWERGNLSAFLSLKGDK